MTEGPRLKDLGRWLSGGTPPKTDETAWNGTVPWLSAKDIAGTSLREPSVYITPESAAKHSKTVDAGAILMIVRGMALAHGLPVVVTDRHVAFNQDLRALVPHDGLDSRYLHYAFIGSRGRFAPHIDKAAHGTARVIDSMYSERLPVPDLKTQREVAAFLDRECAGIAALEDRTTQFIERLQESWLDDLEQALLTEPARRLKHWGATVQLGPFGSALKAEEYIADGVPLINPVHIHWRGLRPDATVSITEERANELGRWRLRAGDVVVARRGEMGRAATVRAEEDGYFCGTGSAIVRVGPSLDPNYLVLFLLTRAARDHLELSASGSTMMNLDTEALLDLRVPVRPLGDQQEIAARAAKSYQTVSEAISRASAMASLLAEYRASLIAEAVDGTLEVGGLPGLAARVTDRSDGLDHGLEAIR